MDRGSGSRWLPTDRTFKNLAKVLDRSSSESPLTDHRIPGPRVGLLASAFIVAGLLGSGIGAAVLTPDGETRSHADWLMAGYDAARTVHTPDHGPIWDDLAFRVQLPGRLNAPFFAPSGHIVILGRNAYISFDGFNNTQDAPTGPRGIVRLNLDTAHWDTFATFEDAGPGGPDFRGPSSHLLASDGVRLFAVTPFSVQSYDVATGILLHERPHDWRFANENLYLYGRCAAPAVAAGLVAVACALDHQPPGSGCCDGEDVTVVLLDAETLQARWVWSRATSDLPLNTEGDDELLVHPVFVADYPSAPAIIGDRVILGMVENSGVTYQGLGLVGPPAFPSNQYNVYATPAVTRVWGLDLATGSPAWAKYASQSVVGADTPAPGVGSRYAMDVGFQRTVRPTGDSEKVCFKLGNAWKCIRPSDGRTLDAPDPPQVAESRVGEMARDRVESASLAGDAYVIATGEHLLRYNWKSDSEVWYQGLTPGGTHAFAAADRIVSGDRIYAVTANYPPASVLNLAGEGRVYAFNLHQGTVEWNISVRSEFRSSVQDSTRGDFELAIGAGILIVAETLGNVSVYGETGASPKVEPRYGKARPLQPFTVDLGPSKPGLHGPPTAFRVDWGDGTSTDWGPSPSLTHTYQGTGSFIARFMVRNEAGESASLEQVLSVANTPGIAETAFNSENQEVTFFVLGLLITAVAAGLGVFRARRRQRILKKEIRAVDEIHARTTENAADRQRLLAERRAHASVLLRSGDLYEPKFLVLERHLEAAAKAGRASLFDERFDYLPHGLIKRLEQMLIDGRIAGWERDAF
jgi:hypothetical protein